MCCRIHLLTCLILILVAYQLQGIPCHYSCLQCSSNQYYSCNQCSSNRGINGKPYAGMCYCSNQADEDNDGKCTTSNNYNYNSKALIWSFIGLGLALSILMVLIRAMRYFLFKLIQDVQQLSLIMLINLYFPQQFDIFMKEMYKFNISSFTFEVLTNGSLYDISQTSEIISKDGQNIYGKYKLLHKSANFFSNQFTWIIVFLVLVVVCILLRLFRNFLKSYLSLNNQSINRLHNKTQLNGEMQNQSQTALLSKGWYVLYYFINKLTNVVWLNFWITFLYFSLIQINLNVITQINNLTFSSSFAVAGSFFSAVFLSFEIVFLFLLVLKIREETIKPEWMYNNTWVAPIYLIRVNYKSATKYFWFISCIKKMLLALSITLFYQQPINAIISLCVVQSLYIICAVYLEPYEKRYLRIHLYLTQTIKLFVYFGLVNFVEKYVEYQRLIELTKILYVVLSCVFGFNLLFILGTIISQWQVYRYYCGRKMNFCSSLFSKQSSINFIKRSKMCNNVNTEIFQNQSNDSNLNSQETKTIIGYRTNDYLYIYRHQ